MDAATWVFIGLFAAGVFVLVRRLSRGRHSEFNAVDGGSHTVWGGSDKSHGSGCDGAFDGGGSCDGGGGGD